MSGQYVVSAAGTFLDDFTATASLYGVGIVTDEPDSPHLLAPKIKSELYLGFAERDIYVPENVIPTLKEALDDNHVSYKLDTGPERTTASAFRSVRLTIRTRRRRSGPSSSTCTSAG